MNATKWKTWPAAMTDDRRIKAATAASLTVEDLRHLASWCDNQRESWWIPDSGPMLTVEQILRCYHAANDAGYAGLEEWHSEDSTAALRAWRVAAGRTRARKASSCAS